MYAKNNTGKWWLYFNSVEEAKLVYKPEEVGLWQLQYGTDGTDWRKFDNTPNFLCCPDHYRRQLTPELTVRESFEVGDPVCWCGVNGEVIDSVNDINEAYPVRVMFADTPYPKEKFTFCRDGFSINWHKIPSLFHGHDVLRPEDQKYPVIYTLKKEEPKIEKELPSVQVGKCIPKWLENYDLALAGEWDRIKHKGCYLCSKHNPCDTCPICIDTKVKGCGGTPWRRTDPINKDVPAYRDMVLYLMDLQKRLEEKELVHSRYKEAD